MYRREVVSTSSLQSNFATIIDSLAKEDHMIIIDQFWSILYKWSCIWKTDYQQSLDSRMHRHQIPKLGCSANYTWSSRALAYQGEKEMALRQSPPNCVTLREAQCWLAVKYQASDPCLSWNDWDGAQTSYVQVLPIHFAWTANRRKIKHFN